MLNKLKTINWQQLNASQLPNWIVGLCSKSKERRIKSGQKLLGYFGQYDEVLGNSERYKEILSTDVPILVVPFFIELIESPDVKEKARILSILNVLGGYQNKTGLESIHQSRADKIHQYLLDKFDLYLKLLSSDDNNVRIKVMYLLDKFDHKKNFVVDLLLQRLETNKEHDELARLVAAEVIFGRIQSDLKIADLFSERLISVLLQWFTNNIETLSIQTTSAFYLIRLKGNGVERSAIKVLANIIRLPNDFMLNIPTFEECIDTFVQLGIERGSDILLDVFDDQTDQLRIFDIAIALLGLHFGADDYHKIRASKYTIDNEVRVVVTSETTIEPVKKLTNQLQKDVLRHLLAKDEIWEVETNLFDLFSLPKLKADMQKFYG